MGWANCEKKVRRLLLQLCLPVTIDSNEPQSRVRDERERMKTINTLTNKANTHACIEKREAQEQAIKGRVASLEEGKLTGKTDVGRMKQLTVHNTKRRS